MLFLNPIWFGEPVRQLNYTGYYNTQEGKSMELIKIIVDKRPVDCVSCPLNKTYTKDCGKMRSRNVNGGLVAGKVPDARCKLTTNKIC